jgi:hypothetical protein
VVDIRSEGKVAWVLEVPPRSVLEGKHPFLPSRSNFLTCFVAVVYWAE